MSAPVVLAVDGGNSKTDLALVARRRRACSRSCAGRSARRTTSGSTGCAATCSRGCSTRRSHEAGLDARTAPVAEVARAAARRRRLPGRGGGAAATRSSERGWADAYRRRQRHVRRPARRHRARLGRRRRLRRRDQLRRRRARRPPGALPGARRDHAATGAAATTSAWRRSRRRPAARTAAARGRRLERAVPAHFGLETPLELARGDPHRRIDAAPGDRARAARLRRGGATTRSPPAIVERLADEIVALARAALDRLELTQEPVEVVLGGGLLQARGRPRCSTRSRAGCAQVGAADRSCGRRRRRRSSARRCSRSTQLGADARGARTRRRASSSTATRRDADASEEAHDG